MTELAMDRQSTNEAAALRFFELLGSMEIEAWGELWQQDARLIVFYPPEGFPSLIEGKEEILNGFRDLFARFASFEADLTGVYPAADSEVVCVEYDARATLDDGAEYTNKNIAVIRFSDGLISAYHDYFDPRRFQMVVDRIGGS